MVTGAEWLFKAMGGTRMPIPKQAPALALASYVDNATEGILFRQGPVRQGPPTRAERAGVKNTMRRIGDGLGARERLVARNASLTENLDTRPRIHAYSALRQCGPDRSRCSAD